MAEINDGEKKTDHFERLVQKASEEVGALKRLVWINPTREEEHAKDWLSKGAKLERSRQFRGEVDIQPF